MRNCFKTCCFVQNVYVVHLCNEEAHLEEKKPFWGGGGGALIKNANGADNKK